MLTFNCDVERRTRCPGPSVTHVLRPFAFQGMDLHGNEVAEIDLQGTCITVYDSLGAEQILKAERLDPPSLGFDLQHGGAQLVFGSARYMYLNVYLGKDDFLGWSADLEIAFTSPSHSASLTLGSDFCHGERNMLNHWLNGARFSDDVKLFAAQVPDLSLVLAKSWK